MQRCPTTLLILSSHEIGKSQASLLIEALFFAVNDELALPSL
jgi:hypothetical protein